jgi:hypothetical protein
MSIQISLSASTSRAALAAVAILAVAWLAGSPAQAATRSMTGAMFVGAPSANIEGGVGVFGRKVGGVGPVTYAPTDGAKTISVAGTTTGTFVGRSVTLAAGQLSISGTVFNDFPPFSNVGQLSRSFMSPIEAAVFAENSGALADCPGPGCTASGAGTAISWCPPISENPTAPAPGTVAAQIGNWDCPSWPAGAGGGDRFIRFGLSNNTGRQNFGGTFSLLRNFVQNVWRVPVQPSTPNAPDAEATRTFMIVTDLPWTPGRPNFAYQSAEVIKGPRVFARLNGNGAVQSTFGCTNGVGTPGGSFMQGSPIPALGNNCGTNMDPNAAVQAWGFKLTTGTISGSDPYPFGLVVTTVGGTPFNPNFGTQPVSQGFFFSRMGADAVSGTNRNLVLLGGAVAVDPDSGNAFFRIMDLQMNLQVPEPTTSLGLLAGAGALIALARRRRA